MPRLAKQLAYGCLFLAVFAAGTGLLYLAFLPQQSCTNDRHDWGEEGVDCGGACARACLPAELRRLEVVPEGTVQSLLNLVYLAFVVNSLVFLLTGLAIEWRVLATIGVGAIIVAA